MNKKKLIIIIVLVLVLLGGGGVAAYFMLSSGDDEDKEEELDLSEYKLGEQYTNVGISEGDVGGKKTILKYAPVIVYSNPDLGEEFIKMESAINTEFKKYFISKSEAKLSKLEKVQEDLTEIVKEVVGEETAPDIQNVLMPVYIFQ